MAEQKLSRPERNVQTKQRNLARKLERQQQHNERMKKRMKLSPQAQLNELDFRLGFGEGAKKERARLKSQIEQKKIA